MQPPQAARPHLAGFGCATKLLRIAKLSPESSPCPDAAIQTPNFTKPLVFTGVIGQNARRTPLFATPFRRGEKDFEGTPRRPSPACPPTSGCRHLRGPTWHPKTPNMQLPSLFTAQSGPHVHNTTIQSPLPGAPGHPADRPRATQRRPACSYPRFFTAQHGPHAH